MSWQLPLRIATFFTSYRVLLAELLDPQVLPQAHEIVLLTNRTGNLKVLINQSLQQPSMLALTLHCIFFFPTLFTLCTRGLTTVGPAFALGRSFLGCNENSLPAIPCVPWPQVAMGLRRVPGPGELVYTRGVLSHRAVYMETLHAVFLSSAAYSASLQSQQTQESSQLMLRFPRSNESRFHFQLTLARLSLSAWSHVHFGTQFLTIKRNLI